MPKYIKLDIEKLYEKLKNSIHECIFDDNAKCDDCPFCGIFNCRMVEYLESIETIEVNEDAISRKWVLNEIITKVEDDDSLTDEQKDSLSAAKYLIRHAPPVVPSVIPQPKEAEQAERDIRRARRRG